MLQGKAKDVVRALQAEHYASAMQAKKEGKLVAWVASIAPREFLEAMEIATIYPENHAAVIGAKKGSIDQMEVAESLGYSMDICSYARVNLGYVEAKKAAPVAAPYPDLVVACNNICNTITKWYEALAHRLGVPLVMFDFPFTHDDEPSEHALDFLVGEFTEAIRQIEQICGRKFDYDRLQEVMKISNRTSKLWRECQQIAKSIPSPIDVLEMFNYMAPAVYLRGNEKAIEFFSLLRDELVEKKEMGESAIGGEKYRILWDGIAIWFNLRNLANCLQSYQACMVASTYPDLWILEYDDLRSMAYAYASIFLNRNLNYRVNNMARMVKEFSIDGVIIHSPRSCKSWDFVQYALSGEVKKITGVPVIVVDGDQTDPRHFSEAQFETRVQALFEMIESRKGNLATA